MDITAERLDDFFARYAGSLTAFDADAAAALWSTPGLVVDDNASIVAASREEMAVGVQASYPLYKQLGLASVDHELLDVTRVTERLAFAHVRFVFRDADGSRLTDTTSHYLLRDEDGELRATMCIETDAAENLRALAAERGVKLPDA